MDPVSGVTAAASSAHPGTVQGHAAVMVLNKALNLQAASAAQPIAALSRPALETADTLGTIVNPCV